MSRTPPARVDRRSRSWRSWCSSSRCGRAAGRRRCAARTRSLASELRCVDCEGLSVAESATASARQQRRDIAARIRRGESDDEIRQVYVDRFGESILLKPSSDGIGVIVWALPVVVLLVGAGGLVARAPALAAANRAWSRPTPTRRSSRERASRSRSRSRRERPGSRSRRARGGTRASCCARSTTSTPSAPTATSTTRRTRASTPTTPPARRAVHAPARRRRRGRRCAEAPPVSTRRRVLTVVGHRRVRGRSPAIALAYGLGARLPGQTITGNQARTSSRRPPPPRRRSRALRAAVRAKPDDAAARLALGPGATWGPRTAPARWRSSGRRRSSTRRTRSPSPTAAG